MIIDNQFWLWLVLNHLPSLTWDRYLKRPLGLLLFTLDSLKDSGDMVHIFEDGTRLKIPWDYPTFTYQGLRFASKIAFNCLAYVALTVKSIQLVYGSISEEPTEDCRNICPENLEKYQIEQCLDRSLFLPYQGRIFLRKWLTHITTVQGVPTQTVIFHFALVGRNMQASFGLKVIWESWIADFLLMTLGFGQK